MTRMLTKAGAAAVIGLLLVGALLSPGRYEIRNHSCDAVRGSWNERSRQCELWHPRGSTDGKLPMMFPPSPLDLSWWWSLLPRGEQKPLKPANL